MLKNDRGERKLLVVHVIATKNIDLDINGFCLIRAIYLDVFDPISCKKKKKLNRGRIKVLDLRLFLVF